MKNLMVFQYFPQYFTQYFPLSSLYIFAISSTVFGLMMQYHSLKFYSVETMHAVEHL